jgi:tritrans,polycis-undecaprenyl-diphosphate synthase [geranylgeranyl-diphosphate specific]
MTTMKFEKVPRHIGIILDGNRRFAKKLMLKPWMGHEWGAKKFKEFLEWCHQTGIQEITAYAFSMQNFGRPKEEFDYLMKLFIKEFKELATKENIEELKQKGIRTNFIGRTSLFPEPVQNAMKHLMEQTKNNKPYQVNFAMAYGGREEVIDAVKKLGEDIKKGAVDIEKLNEEVFGSYLYLNSDPDLIIRTGGEKRTSNFLPWQGTYSELFFIEKTWPEMEKQDFLAIIKEFNDRDRRFGK